MQHCCKNTLSLIILEPCLVDKKISRSYLIAVLPNDSRGYKSSASRLRQTDHMLTLLLVYMLTCLHMHLRTGLKFNSISLCRQLTWIYKLICVHCTMLGWHNIEQMANRCPRCQPPGNCTIFCFQIQDSNTAPAWVGHISL